MASRNNNRYNNGNNGNNGNRNSANETKFCAVCHAAERPGYDTHFVRADKFDRLSAITCPYLMSIQCRNCGGTGHTASYCTASRASSIAVAAPHPTSLARVRLPPISSSSSSSHYSSKHPPRIVFPGLEKEQKERDYPQLVSNRKTQSTTTLPPLPLSFSRFCNDEPLLKRGPPEASPVHSPAAAPSNKVVYNKRGNAFADLASSSDDDEVEHLSPIHSPDAVGRYRPTKPLSWPSLAPVVSAVSAEAAVVLKPKPRVIAPPRLEPLLPPPAFKPRKVASAGASAVPKDKKKLWGDTDSEDDEEFLNRGGLE